MIVQTVVGMTSAFKQDSLSIRQSQDVTEQEAAVGLQRATSGGGSCVGRRELAGCNSFIFRGLSILAHSLRREGALEVRPLSSPPLCW